MIGFLRSLTTRLLLASIRAYQLLLSPLLGANCRYEPSCSRYAQDALLQHGLRRGLRLSVGRILRCHPWSPGGFDPVPDELSRAQGPVSRASTHPRASTHQS